MTNPFRLILSKLPEGHLKSLAKNISSFAMNRMPQPIETVHVDGETIKVYKDNVFDNLSQVKEIKGYTAYYTIKKGDYILEAGAYTGLFTIFASKKVGKTGRVISFEPDPYNNIMLKRNLKLNNITNVTVIKKGLYSKEDRLPFDIQSIGSNIVSLNTPFHNRATINKIDVTTADKELKHLHIKKINLVTMDIEGSEIEAMSGFTEIIKMNKNIHFAIASYHIVDGKKTKFFLEKFFKNLKFKIKTEDNGQLTTYASRSNFPRKTKVNVN
jgi:FkbM family methyltransferase